MAELARRYGEVPVPLGAVVQVISRADMERIVVALRKGGGLWQATRGARGGYVVAGSPQSMTIEDVLGALGGAVVSFTCVSDTSHPPCMRDKVAWASGVVCERIGDVLMEALDSMMLADPC